MYSQTGSYVALAGLIVMILGHFGVVVADNDIVGVLSAVATIYGIGHQFFAHRNLAIQTGAFK